jgi:hypothetical protein
MLGFLWRRFTRRKRNLFSYWDGSRMRSDDPLAIQMRIETHPTCRWDVHPIAAERGDVEAYKITLNAICDVFKVRMFDPDQPGGLTHEELMTLLGQYADYVDALKKNTGPLPTWRAASDATSAPSSGTTTSDTSGSASTSTA